MTGDVLPIRSLDEITIDWLRGVLRHAGFETSADRLIGVEVDGFGADGRGFMSHVVRVELVYDDDAAPGSVIVKLPPVDATRFRLGASINAFQREMRFYRDIAPNSPVCVPKCYYAGGDETTGAAVIVLGDAKAWQPANQILGLKHEQAEATIDMIAAFHARWWEAPELGGLEWVPGHAFDYDTAFATSWPDFVKEYRHWLTAEAIRIGDRLASSGAALGSAVDRSPRTLVHCDLRADNLMIDGPDPSRPVMLLDWQILSRTMGAIDPARLVCGSLETALSADGYRAYAQRWHRQLVSGGVSGYSDDEAWRDFRVGLLNALHIPVCYHSNISHEGTVGIRLLEAQVHRMFRAIEECNALGALAD